MNANIVQRVELPWRHVPHPNIPYPSSRHIPHPRDPVHVWAHTMSRRQFVRAALGTFAGGAIFSTGFMKPMEAFGGRSSSSVLPLPIPAGGGDFRVFGPGPESLGPGFDPIDAEPATITDFNGFVGLAYLNGTVTQTNTATGEVQTFPFLLSDMRFMKGVYRGTDG